jgi:glycine/D-amino acid oxidase-like deaminating enzyme
MEEIAAATCNRINMTRRGYALVTRRADPVDLIAELYQGYGRDADRLIRIHDRPKASTYQPPVSADWDRPPGGVDVLCEPSLIQKTFPFYAPDVQAVLHIRRAGSISGQQLGQFMLEAISMAGGCLLRGEVVAVEEMAPCTLAIDTSDGRVSLRAARLVNAAGPFLGDIGAMLGEEVPVSCVYQQKIALEDREGAVARTMPFTIDLDSQILPWSDEERTILAEDPATACLLAPMPGGIHCRPDGAESGSWIKLGWAINSRATDPHAPDPLDPQFPDIVLRAASRLHPALKRYIGRLPRGAHHYGGYYIMTEENWPLIGPTRTPGVFLAGALSGYGTMGACMAGAIGAAWVAGGNLPNYARALSPERHMDAVLMAELAAMNSRGVL